MKIYTKKLRSFERGINKLRAIRAIIMNNDYVIIGDQMTFAAVRQVNAQPLIKEARFAIKKLKEMA